MRFREEVTFGGGKVIRDGMGRHKPEIWNVWTWLCQ